MMNNNQTVTCQKGGWNTHKQIVNNTREDNNNIQEGENCIKARYGRIIRKPDRLSYQ